MRSFSKTSPGTAAVALLVTLNALFPLPAPAAPADDSPIQVSGRYPHLAMFNHQGECGTGAVVPWADRLWVITYAPHLPNGSDDKLYEIDADLRRVIRPESVGGTPGRPADPPRIQPTDHRPLLHRRAAQRARGAAQADARPADRRRPAPDRPGQQGLRLRHGGGLVRGGRPHAGRQQALRPRRPRRPRQGGVHRPGPAGRRQQRQRRRQQGRARRWPTRPTPKTPRPRARWPSGTARTWRDRRAPAVHRRHRPRRHRRLAADDRSPLWAIGWDKRSVLLKLLDGGALAHLPPADRRLLLRRHARLVHRMAAHPRGRPAASC